MNGRIKGRSEEEERLYRCYGSNIKNDERDERKIEKRGGSKYRK